MTDSVPPIRIARQARASARKVDAPVERRDVPAQPRAPQDRLGRAREAYERDRYEECLRLLRRLEEERPLEADGLELRGLSLYRIGRYEAARRALVAYRDASESVAHLPVQMDCARALGRANDVEALWHELREISPGKEVIVEGRLVYAGYLADRGRVSEAIALLRAGLGREQRGSTLTSLRQRYLLANLLERTGQVAEARALYAQLVAEDPSLYDAAERLAGLA